MHVGERKQSENYFKKESENVTSLYERLHSYTFGKKVGAVEEKGRGEEGGPFFPRQKRGEESEKGAILSTVRGSLTRARRGEGERRSSLSFKKRRRGKTLLFVPVLFIPRGKNEDERKQERLEIGVAYSPNDRPFRFFFCRKKKRGETLALVSSFVSAFKNT